MTDSSFYEVIIIGGSYSGLSAAMALGRSLRKVLIIDSGKPCNRQTPHSHNFITQDGKKPAQIAQEAKDQVLKYDTVKFYEGLATEGKKTAQGYQITTASGAVFTCTKLLFATGVADEMPDIKGFTECWGISVLHCPYCHGYEVKGATIGLIGNGELGFELSKLLSNWSKDLVLFTNGASTLTEEQTQKLNEHNIRIVEQEIDHIEHQDGYMQNIVLKDGTKEKITAAFARVNFHQHCDIPRQLECEITEQGYIKVDAMQRTSVYDIFAAGDNSVMFRSVAVVVAAGTMAGAVINKDLIGEEF